MSPIKQRAAIAKVFGWTQQVVEREEGYGTTLWWVHPTLKYSPPDYLNDLNAMHEVEKILLPVITSYSEAIKGLNDDIPMLENKWATYTMTLTAIVAEKMGGWHDHFLNAMSLLPYAESAQRAEAFLKTLGLWEEDICK